VIQAKCVRDCYDSTGCKFYKKDALYTIDEKAFAVKGGNGLLKHFLPFAEMDRDQVKLAEKQFEDQLGKEERARKNTRAAAMKVEPSEKPRARARA
jgi:hypothetical protein